MKKTLVLAFVTLFSIVTMKAQDENKISDSSINGFSAEDIFISGTLSYDNENDKGRDIKDNSFKFRPQVGYFLDNNIAIGLYLAYQSDIQDSPSAIIPNSRQEIKLSIIEGGVFGRYYINPRNRFSVFGELGVGIVSSELEVTGLPKTDGNGWGVSFNPGINYFLSQHFALQANIGALEYNSAKLGEQGSVDEFKLGVNLSDIKIGLVYKF